MRLTEFDYDIICMMAINGHELGYLLRQSQKHYDGKCQAAGRVGGFLYGFIQQWMITAEGDYSFGGDLPDPPNLDRVEIIKMNGHQIDTLGKICEMNQEDNPPVTTFDFIQLLKKCKAEYERIDGGKIDDQMPRPDTRYGQMGRD